MHRRPRHRSSSQGVALIAVLWLVGLLTLLASACAVVSVSHRRAADRLAQRVKMDVSADSAIRLAALRIIQPQQSALGSSLDLEMPAGSAHVTIERERARIDLNTADEQLIFAVFAANGWDAARAHAMAARIADWTDVDDEPRQNGAEARDYAAAGRPYGPRNGPFESVEELHQVLGSENISPELFEAFTVYSHERVPTLATNEAVANALKYADAQRLGDQSWPIVAQDTTRTFIGEVLRVRACVENKNAKSCRLAILRITGSNGHPLLIYAWRTAGEVTKDY